MSRVMIVENLERPLWSAKNLLKSINFEIVLDTGNGYEAIEKYDLIKPDFILLDLSISKNDGLIVLKEIKKINNDAKIIVVPSMNDDSQFEECHKSGVYSILRIPFKLKSFLELVNRPDLTYENKSPVAPVIVDDSS